MKAYEIGPQNGLDGMRLVERADPIPGEGELLLNVKAACLNHRDLLTLNGAYGALKSENRIPVSDGVGEIIAIGDGVTGFEQGQRIIAPHFAQWHNGPFEASTFGHDLGVTADGWLAEKIIIPASAAIIVPDAVSNEQAATLAGAGITVWHALVRFGGLKKGDWILAPGTGGVSIFALQVGKALGAQVAITSSSDEKLDLCRKLGADVTINYRTSDDWSAELFAKTEGNGADIVIETAGFATLSQSIAAAAVNGRIALIGALAGAPGSEPPNFFGVIGKNLTLKGITSGSRDMMAELLNCIAANDIIPVVDRQFSFSDAPAAYQWLAAGGHVGKIMIKS